MVEQTQFECLSPSQAAHCQHQEGENGLFHLFVFLSM